MMSLMSLKFCWLSVKKRKTICASAINTLIVSIDVTKAGREQIVVYNGKYEIIVIYPNLIY